MHKVVVDQVQLSSTVGNDSILPRQTPQSACWP
jgi:hypothetical protein